MNSEIYAAMTQRSMSQSIRFSGIFSYELNVFGLSPNRLLVIESSNANAGRLVLAEQRNILAV